MFCPNEVVSETTAFLTCGIVIWFPEEPEIPAMSKPPNNIDRKVFMKEKLSSKVRPISAKPVTVQQVSIAFGVIPKPVVSAFVARH